MNKILQIQYRLENNAITNLVIFRYLKSRIIYFYFYVFVDFELFALIKWPF